ncbi:MAG TPA: response regulator [Pyrinomonadaceae bacterium]|jgi:DNA-binding response OmpR family regulator|nr:response regulator [Pyrinomonadaceae bacterium]
METRSARILLVEDNPRWRRTVGGVLQRAGFNLTSANSIAAARESLRKGFFHLIVLDIQMDASDASNEDGMHLLKELSELNLLDSTRVVMLSGWGTLKRMRDAFSRYQVADFFTKNDFKGSEFVARVQQIFAESVKCNLNLDIQWQTGDAVEGVRNLRIDGNRIKKDTAGQDLLAAELEDLLCRLFHSAIGILARPLKRGQSGNGVLTVQPFYSFGAGQARVVKYGQVSEIYNENHNFETYVKNYLGRSTIVHAIRRTPRLAGILYSFLGAANEQTESFSDYYTHASISDVQEVLDRLFLVTCEAWYSSPGQLRPLDLTRHYQERMGFTQENLERAVADKLKANLGKNNTLSFAVLGDRSFNNPIPAVATKRFIRTTYECITHGDLNASNIFVDSDRHAWLIDFGCTGPGHILRDVAELDSMVRFQLLSGDSATLEERLLLEEALNEIALTNIGGSSVKFVTENPAVAKAFHVSLHLRSLAAKLTSPHRDTDMSEYQIALLYYGVNTIRFYALDTVQRQHALISSSLLADRISP